MAKTYEVAVFDGAKWVALRGEKGEPGTGINIKGSHASVADLPATGTAGDAWLVGGHLHVWDDANSAWQDVGDIQGPQGLQGIKGDKGDTGSSGIDGTSATIRVGTVTTGAPGSKVQVSNTGTNSAAVLEFHIPEGQVGPKGDRGDTGTAATVTVGTVSDLPAGTNATVSNSGNTAAAVLNFGIPAGQAGAKGDRGDAGPQGVAGVDGKDGVTPTIAVGTTTTGAAGSAAQVVDSGTAPNHVYDFTIPVGATGATGPAGRDGAAATITIGTVAQGTSAAVSNSGTSSAAVLDFTLVKGDKGDPGNDGAKGDPGTPGRDGSGVTIKGTVDGGTWPPAGAHAAGDMWLIGTPVPTGAPAGAVTGHGVVYDGTTWKDVGPIQGPAGRDGAAGPAGPAGAAGPAGPSAVSADANNNARLGTDSLIFVPTPAIPVAANAAPLPLAGTAAIGTSTDYAREDHVHIYPTPAQIGAATTAHTHAAAAITGLSAVAVSGQYADLAGKPAAYTLPVATAGVLGGVKVGTGINVDAQGVISVAAGAGGTTVVDATSTVKGIVRLAAAADLTGSGSTAAVVTGAQLVTATNGLAPLAGPAFTGQVKMPAGSAGSPGLTFSGDLDTGIFQANAGTLSFGANGGQKMLISTAGVAITGALTAGGNTYPSTTGTAGQHLSTDGTGTLTWVDPVTLLPATAAVLGGIKVGSGLNVQTDGTLSVNWTVASTTQQGVVSLADAAAITAGTANRVVDAAGLKTVADLKVAKAGDTMTGSLVVPDGTAAAPAVKFDDATGIYQPAADSFAVSTAGVERLRVDGSGNIGVGFAGRTYDRLSIGGNAATNQNPRGVSVEHVLAGVSTGASSSFVSSPSTSVAAWGVYHFNINDTAGSGTISNQFGLNVNDLQKANTNHGVRVKVNEGAGKNNYCIFADGTAPNYFQGQVQMAPGTAAKPALCWYGEGATGAFRPATDTFAISTAGTERLRVNATGQITAATGYTPTAALDLVTKEYADNIATGGFTLPTASNATLGGIKVGNGLAIDASGVLSVDPASLGGTTVTIPAGVDATLSAPSLMAPLPGIIPTTSIFYVGKFAYFFYLAQTPTYATGIAIRFRQVGDTNWTVGVTGYGMATRTDLNVAFQYADFNAMQAAAPTYYLAVMTFGDTAGTQYEYQVAYMSAAGTGAWSPTKGPFTPTA